MIDIKSLDFRYKKKLILSDLDLRLRSGNIYGLLGKNGSGKTTLLHCIAGLLFPKRGSISVNGYIPKDRKPAFLSNLFIVPETFYLPNLSLKKIEYFYTQLYPKFDLTLFRNLLVDFELDRPEHWSHLSFGQRKKVLISLGIASQTNILLLDEPTNGLDIPAKSQLNKALATLLDQDRIVIISTHHVKDIERLLDRILILDQGRIQINQSLSEITRRFTFSHAGHDSNSIYSDQSMVGLSTVSINSNGEEGMMDVELFYKAYHHDAKCILSHLNQQSL